MLEQQTLYQTVQSADRTLISFSTAGAGEPLLLVHGTGADATRWSAVIPYLAGSFTVVSIDRRGHGASGDSDQYQIEREYEDLVAVASTFNGPVNILGHSFGAGCVLGAAPSIPNLKRLVLYEPPMMSEQQTSKRIEQLQRMDLALEAGDRETVVLILLTEMLMVPLPAVDRLRRLPAWAGSLAAAHTIPRELRSSAAYAANKSAIQSIANPTLLLLGGDSPAFFHATTQILHAWLTNSRICILPGQQHSAMLTAPELFANEVSRFLIE